MTSRRLAAVGLAARLALAVVVVSGTLLIAYGWVASELAQRELKDELGVTLATVARVAAADEKVRTLEFAIIRGGAVVEAAKPRLERLTNAAGIGNLMVLDAENRVVVDARGRYQFHDPAWRVQLDRAELKRVWEKGEVAYSPVYTGEEGRLYLSAYAPVLGAGGVVLAVGAEASANFLHSVSYLRRRFTKIGLMVLGAAALLGWLLAQTITRPLRRLREATERVARGDYAVRADDSGHTEVGDLARAFNRMAQRINEHYAKLLESMSNGLVAVDRAGVVTELNGAAEGLLGVRRGTVVGQGFRGRLPQELESALEDTLTGGEALHGEKHAVTGTGGAARILQVTTSMLKDEDGTIRGAEALILDVTELERLTEALETHKRFAAIGEMAAEVAHQIRNPLATIQFIADVLRKDLPPEGKGREYLADLLKEVTTLEDIVSKFLTYAGPSRLDLRPLEVGETVTALCRTMAAEFDHARVALSADVRRPLPVIRADASSVEQVLANLMRNALEACQPGGRVTVTAAEANGGAAPGVLLAVEDDGAGLKPDIRPRLFTPFVTTKAQGTGLGLSLAKKFVEAHGGTIALTPLARGTRAEVRLPTEPIADVAVAR